MILLQYSSKRPSCSGVPVMTTERLPLRIDSTGGSTVRTSWAELLEKLGDAVRVDIGHRDHRRLVTAPDHAAAARDQRPGRADQLQQRQQLGILGALGPQRFGGHDALRVTGHRDRRGSVQIQALPRQRANRGHLGEQNARARDRGGDQLLGGGQRLLGGQRPHPLHRLEADRPHDDQLAGHRLEKQRRLTDDLTELGFDARRADQLLQVLQPGAALAAERDRIRLPGVQPIDEGVCSLPVVSEDSFLRPVVTLSAVR